MQRFVIKIHSWLERLFDGQPVPQYEVNATTMNMLENLYKLNQVCDNDAHNLIEDVKQKALEYSYEALRLSTILSTLGLDKSSLSQSGNVSLNNLAKIALILKLKDTSISSYYCGIHHLARDTRSVERMHNMEKRLIDALTIKHRDSIVKSSALKRTLRELTDHAAETEPKLEQRLRETAFLGRKSQEYQKIITELKKANKEVNMDPSLYHSNLVKRAKDLQMLKEELAPLQAKWKSYHSLPADISLAKVKLEEAKQEMVRLEMELERRIGSI
ncbi:uncharacterized protein TRIADDRAFT_60376 [Trichoplax adhaerens]|uniref:HAUS augmin-like complex subunit 1 n=1 Tax=Trichoplax adhaerens TaxID=10228 RepID=B3S820_TRIAD|nr:hypothetical protein TRIADDRAFT_60376 [Trichoplax adhaerens]EDV21117.1 hypothetical protein TRIADDRAFT_60376 [Trichoplax adhaerens]|eukprot:XP_002116447.1 hypothetical protein TRIADDRAFT_60376 [Trichoplax adhaerens]